MIDLRIFDEALCEVMAMARAAGVDPRSHTRVEAGILEMRAEWMVIQDRRERYSTEIDLPRVLQAWEEIVQDRYDIADEYVPSKDEVRDVVAKALPYLFEAYVDHMQVKAQVTRAFERVAAGKYDAPEYQI